MVNEKSFAPPRSESNHQVVNRPVPCCEYNLFSIFKKPPRVRRGVTTANGRVLYYNHMRAVEDLIKSSIEFADFNEYAIEEEMFAPTPRSMSNREPCHRDSSELVTFT